MIIDRLTAILNSPMGGFLVILCLVTAVMVALYGVLALRKKKRDALAYAHRQYYEQAEAQMVGWKLEGVPSAQVFGRRVRVRHSSGKPGLSLIPPPNLADERIKSRFGQFLRAASDRHYLAAVEFAELEKAFVVVYENAAGTLQNVRHCMMDGNISTAETERLLIDLARGLDDLHSLRCDNGDRLYHGFLVPASILVDFDTEGVYKRFIVSDAGFAYALGPERAHDQLESFRQGKLVVDRTFQVALTEQINCLAPEQRDVSRLEEVGPESDFYAYAAVAVTLFTQERFVYPGGITWSKVPANWRPFLKQCLEDAPLQRPKDFAEVEDWLNDPELLLTHNGETPTVVEGYVKKKLELSQLTPLLDEIQRRKGGIDERAERTQDWLSEGQTLLKRGKWVEAEQAFKQAFAVDADCVEAMVYIGICAYESGDLDRAEEYYGKAQGRDPKRAELFMEYMLKKSKA